MNKPVLDTIRTSRGFSRSVTYLIIVALLGVVLERSIYYALRTADAIPAENVVEKLNRVAPYKARLLGLSKTSVAPTTQAQQTEEKKSGEAKLSEAVVEVQDTLDVLTYELINKGDPARAEAKLIQLRTALQQQDQQAMASFAETAVWIEEHRLDPVIAQRHEAMVDNYRTEMDSLMERLQDVQTAEKHDDKLAAALMARKQLEEKQLKRSQQPFDPNDLNPVFSADPQNTPRVKKEDFNRAGLFDTPYPKLAALGDFKYDTLVGANDPAYLAETAEITLSQFIKDKAAALNYDPVQIHHWVRNNVEWLPTWGAYQNADLTLSSQRGNAMDIASLTIALLRASGVPARYVHGTINVPADKFTNWAGDFANVEAAVHYASAGGIPTTSIISGGKISSIELEHIWVEAAIDYLPSRGAINLQADSWVQMDPTYKQYAYNQGLDVATISGQDSQNVIDTFIASGTINESEGWTQGFDPTVIQNAQAQAKQALQDHISAMTNPTVGNVIGGRKAIIREYPTLPSSLPNPIVVTGVRYGELPDGLRNRMSLAIGTDYLGYPQAPITLPMASLNNQRITLSFRPATAVDETALQALLPQGQITDVSQLPARIPAYLIQVIPELKLNGTVIKSGTAMSLGNEVGFTYQFRRPIETQAPYTYQVTAGSYLAIVVMGQSVGLQQLNELQTRLKNTETILQTQDPAQLSNITRENLLGDMLHTGVLSYYTEYNAISHIMAKQQHAEHNLAVGYGSYGYETRVNYFFGFPRSIETGGMVFNLRAGDFVATHTVDSAQLAQFRQHIGMLASTLEHSIPEQMFTSATNPGEAISAVKALIKAQNAGQKIYHITQANMATTLPNIHLDADTMTEIRNSVMVGKEVTVHTDPVSVPGWTGAGYIIMDPDTGIGAYKIAGGMNGGWLVLLGFIFIAIIALSSLMLGPLGGLFGIYTAWNLGNKFAEKVKELSSLSPPERTQQLALSVAILGAEAIFSVILCNRISTATSPLDREWANLQRKVIISFLYNAIVNNIAVF